MKVTGLDNKAYSLNLKGKPPRKSVSAGHLAAREFLKERYGFDTILEEIHLPGCVGSLFVDFLLPNRRLAVEVQGQQHRVYVAHFHLSPQGFLQQKRRDAVKRQWCETNGFTLVELPDDRIAEWPEIFRGETT